MHFLVNPTSLESGTVSVPGDKSVSHRAVMLGSIADGRTRVSGFLAGEDCLATMAAFQAMGVVIDRPSESELVIEGRGLHGLEAPSHALDLGNSGTAMRLMGGLLSGQAFPSVLTGDESLSSRPMQRIIGPLELMGASILSEDGRPPLRIAGNASLAGIDYTLPIASAQVKSAVLLAGLYADGITTVHEPAVTRDHTERMLRTMGVAVDSDGGRISLQGGQALSATDVAVPSDLSSAAFVMLAVLLSGDADVLIRNVGINPTRTGVIDILQSMGADIEVGKPRLTGEEPVADIRVRGTRLSGVDVDPALVSLAIDEFPALFVAAAAAEGSTRFSGLGELRVKESDRITAMASGLRALGIEIEETQDGAIVHGGQLQAGEVASYGDHRIAMAFAAAATSALGPVTIRDVANVATSFPGFEQLGADIVTVEGVAA